MKHFFCTDCDAERDTEILDLHGQPHEGCTGLWVGQPDNDDKQPDNDDYRIDMTDEQQWAAEEIQEEARREFEIQLSRRLE